MYMYNFQITFYWNTIAVMKHFHLLKKNSENELTIQGKTLGLYTDGWIDRLIY